MGCSRCLPGLDRYWSELGRGDLGRALAAEEGWLISVDWLQFPTAHRRNDFKHSCFGNHGYFLLVTKTLTTSSLAVSWNSHIRVVPGVESKKLNEELKTDQMNLRLKNARSLSDTAIYNMPVLAGTDPKSCCIPSM